MDIARDICTDSFYIVNSGLPCIPVTAVWLTDSLIKKNLGHRIKKTLGTARVVELQRCSSLVSHLYVYQQHIMIFLDILESVGGLTSKKRLSKLKNCQNSQEFECRICLFVLYLLSLYFMKKVAPCYNLFLILHICHGLKENKVKCYQTWILHNTTDFLFKICEKTVSSDYSYMGESQMWCLTLPNHTIP